MRYFSIVLISLVISYTAFADTIYEEGFEGGVMPTDWQVWQEGPSSSTQWRFDQTSYPHSGTYYCFHGYDSSQDLDNWAVTQTFDMRTWENLVVSFWHYGSYPSDYGYTGFMGADVENPTAADFVEIEELGAPPTSYTQLIADCSAYDTLEFVTFAWQYTGMNAHTVRMDDVLVEGDPYVGIESASIGEIKATFK